MGTEPADGADRRDLILPSHWPEMLWLPMRGMPKKRPRVTANGTYMPHDYVEWKEQFGYEMAIATETSAPIDVPVHLFVSFRSDAIGVQLKPLPGAIRPKHMRTQDIDNMTGAVMDAMQDAKVIVNDKQVFELSARIHG